MRRAPVLSGILVVALQVAFSASSFIPGNKIKVPDKVQLKADPFALEDVRLLEGPFREAMLRDQKYLLELDADRLLHNFRVTAGLPSLAKPLGGWEDPQGELRGHSVGHYLSACAMMYASTGDARFKDKAGYLVAELAKVQQTMPSKGFHAGYLSAYPEEFFDRVDKRIQVWAPYYTLHKIMAGLLDMYFYCDNAQALEVVTKMADWVKFRVDRLTDEQQQAVLNTEHGGMNEVLANLYSVTGNPEYLRIAYKFNQKSLFDQWAAGEDRLDGLHGNTQFPKVIGAAREYELTGESRYYDIAKFFWERVALHRSFVTGGNTDGESFFPISQFSKHLGASSTETCNTYNMLKLTRNLFAMDPSTEKMDFYERGLFNHILGAQDPDTGMMCYYVPLRPGAFEGKGVRESRGGWFSYDLKVIPDKPMLLVCTYVGSEGRTRAFDVLVDGQKIATQSLEIHPTELFDVEYKLPESLTRGKLKITVKFQALPNATAGQVLDVRVAKQ